MSGANPANFSAGQQIANPIYIVDSSGNQISSFGGGTQYTTGAATPGSPIGTMPVFDSGGTIAKVSLAVGLPVNIVGGGGSGGTSLADNTAFTAGATTLTPVGGVYNDAVAAATSGDDATVRLSQNRAFHINIRNNAGTELATASNPLVATGNKTNNNAAPGATNIGALVGIANVAAPSYTEGDQVLISTDLSGNTRVNVTNANANGQTTMANSAPVTIASNQSAVAVGVVAGTALTADQTNTILKTSLYVKTSAAADTVLTVGSAASANSLPVVVASDQGAIQIKRSTVAAYTLASVTTSGATQNSGDITVGPYTEISVDINTTAQAGTSPTIQYFYERKAADGIYYILWQSAVLTAATNTLSTSIGAGMAYNQSLGVTGRLRWVVGGSATPTFTHSINIQGK